MYWRSQAGSRCGGGGLERRRGCCGVVGGRAGRRRSGPEPGTLGVTLSAYEKRVLREIDDDLSAQDPLLASRFSAFRGFRLRLWQVGTCFVVGVCLCAAGLTRAGGGGEALALCGYLVIVGSAGWLFGMVVDRLRRRCCGKS